MTTNYKQAFKDMLVCSSVRGVHGTGIAGIGTDNKEDWVKMRGHVYDLLEQKSFDSVASFTKKILIGHNRAATQGAHNNSNAHPFDKPNVIGCHNGTIPTVAKHNLFEAYKFDTDSEAIYHTINHLMAGGQPWDLAVKNTVGMLDEGAWALVMYMKRDDKLIFLRNKERPLYYCLFDDKAGLAWASEHWILRGCLERNNLKIDDTIKLLSEDTMLAWSIDGKKKAPIKDPYRLKAPMKEKTPVNFHQGAMSKNGKTSYTASTANTRPYGTNYGPAIIGGSKPEFPNDHKNKHFKPPYKDHTGAIIKKPEVEQLIKSGGVCVYCNHHTPVWGEEICFLKPSPVGSPQYLCKICIHDPEIMDIMRGMR
jgi:hypothetical protein